MVSVGTMEFYCASPDPIVMVLGIRLATPRYSYSSSITVARYSYYAEQLSCEMDPHFLQSGKI